MRTAFLLLSVMAALGGSAAEPAEMVRVTLELPYDHILPGVPFNFNVRLENVSNRPIAVGAFSTIVITRLDGPTARLELPQNALIGSQYDLFELEPGQAKIGSGPDSNLFYRDFEVNGPGTYEIALELFGKAEDVEVGWEFVERLKTAPVRLTRVEPSGEDAVIWRRMQESMNGRWYSAAFGRNETTIALANEIVSEYPTSQYAPYALLKRSLDPLPLEDALEALECFPTSPTYPRLLRAASDAALREAEQLERNGGGPAEVERLLHLSESLAEKVLASGSAGFRLGAEMNRHQVDAVRERLRQPRVREP